MTIRPGMNPQNRLLTDLVVHVAIVMQHKSSVEILAPFIQMINTPRELKVSFNFKVNFAQSNIIKSLDEVFTYNA